MSGDPTQMDDTGGGDSSLGASPGISDIIRRLDRLWDDRPAPSADALNLRGKMVGGYELREPIGQGAFGVVYLGHDHANNRRVAIKVPRPEVLIETRRLQRFRDEADIAASLEHPSIVQVFSANLDGPSPHIATAFVDGPDLGQWLGRAARPVDFLPASRFVRKLADAVQHAHQHGVAHRDLKPSNVLLRPDTDRPHCLDDYSPVLTDFGLAGLTAPDTHSMGTSTIVGTPLYMAPEQAAGGGGDPKAADIYSLGVMLFQLVTKQTPLGGLTYYLAINQLLTGDTPRVSKLRPDVPTGLQAIITKCLQHAPEDRYASAAELADDLARFIDGQRTRAPAPRQTDWLAAWMRKPQRLRDAGCYAIVFNAAIVIWLLVVLCFAVGYGVAPGGTWLQNIGDILLVTAMFHAPKATLGCLLYRGRLWPYLVSLASSLVLLGVLFSSAVGDSIAFEYNYPTKFSKVSNFSILIMGACGEVVFHLFAWPAWRRARLRASRLAATA